MEQYAEQLLSVNPLVEEVVVFGSFAEGNYAPGSDIDVLIVLRSADKPVWDRIADFLPGAFPVGLDLFPYTREELARMEDSPMTTAFRRSKWRYLSGHRGSGVGPDAVNLREKVLTQPDSRTQKE
jgi:predicted nucleotidyltransferase